MKKNQILTIFFLILTSSCGPYWYKPYGVIFTDLPKGGSPGYNLGWTHGCESGMSMQFGGAIYMTFYKWHKDVDIISAKPDLERIRKRYKKELNINWNDPAEVQKNISDYKKVWPIARAHCKYGSYGAVQLGGIEPPNAQGSDARYDPGAHSLRNIYTIDSIGDTRWTFW